jgi:hypothetical protein
MARHPLVKKKSRLFVLAPGPKIGGLRNLPDEGVTDEGIQNLLRHCAIIGPHAH